MTDSTNTSHRATLTAAEPQLYVTDIAAACAFYRDRLGFSVAFIYGEPPFYAQVMRDDVRLNLRHVDEPVIDPALRDADQLLSTTITLADAPLLYAEFERAGVAFAQPLQVEEWGAQTFVVRDPDGNRILFAGHGT